MLTIEFETKITGRFIEIKDYEKIVNKNARVIVIVEDESIQEDEDFITSVSLNPLDIQKDQKFLTREEANAR